MDLSAPAAMLVRSDHSVLLPATALRYALLQPSTQPASCLDPSITAAAGVVAIDRAAQGETKRRARAWVVGGRKAGWSQGCGLVVVRCRRAASHRTGEGRGVVWSGACVW